MAELAPDAIRTSDETQWWDGSCWRPMTVVAADTPADAMRSSHQVDLVCTRCGLWFAREIEVGRSTWTVKCPGYCAATGEAVVVYGASEPVLVFVRGSEVVPRITAVRPSVH